MNTSAPQSSRIVWHGVAQQDAEIVGLPKNFTGLAFKECAKPHIQVRFGNADQIAPVVWDLSKWDVGYCSNRDWDGWYLMALIATHDVDQSHKVNIYVLGALKGYLMGQA